MTWFSDAVAAVALFLGLSGPPAGPVAHGYVEGEYLRIAAPVAATLDKLNVVRGRTVEAGAPLFALDRTMARAERDRLAAAVAQAKSQRADLTKGKRPEEIAVIAAQTAQTEASLHQTQAELHRQEVLVRRNVGAVERLEAARAARDRDVARLAELSAQLDTARLPARIDQIAAAEAALAMAEAALAQQERRLAEMAPMAPTAALVEDTLYNPGEWVPAGSPVVTLLPPERRKLVVFVPEPLVARVRPGQALPVSCDGCPAGLTAVVAFVAPRAEYTPPVIYSVGSREKLVFRIELAPDPSWSAAPGLPVDVGLPP
ncbi:HlyD family efflux transporter periplasmic adaptor subunit [Azospirillum sp. RWY-5-1]|uniref:HlyD family efflux transporter periplasmic adaptor subunit n=1 Tax=Azospirillum oleiclasticum TaxID=2735135 RepID=A0ABX2TBZ5_9PROT|nr:HlyD family efflux transporter periplasmic adaptor subunit [Azospirillum oleiclasticum]NYZ14215.1 HlyD family efflux transporter periplasmic adaptor subunit [Azospirillum oleiclasticum]NYZ21699.1 HlyD family efflux transporter periplasmic adaptor subunit [Azospirillum oleiclasticum]